MYTIINPDTNEYFSLLNGGLFTSNKEIAVKMSNLSTQQLKTLLIKANQGHNVPYSIIELETELLKRI